MLFVRRLGLFCYVDLSHAGLAWLARRALVRTLALSRCWWLRATLVVGTLFVPVPCLTADLTLRDRLALVDALPASFPGGSSEPARLRQALQLVRGHRERFQLRGQCLDLVVGLFLALGVFALVGFVLFLVGGFFLAVGVLSNVGSLRPVAFAVA